LKASAERKYRNIKTTIDNIVFDSKREAARYADLKILQQIGEISALAMQPQYDLWVNNRRICRYKADFSYFDKAGKLIVEDAKGMRTPVYRLKKKLMAACLGIEIQEV
jgi:hypothetical protein